MGLLEVIVDVVEMSWVSKENYSEEGRRVVELHNRLCPGQVDFTGSRVHFFFCSTLVPSVAQGQLRITEALLGPSQGQNCICSNTKIVFPFLLFSSGVMVEFSRSRGLQ